MQQITSLRCSKKHYLHTITALIYKNTKLLRFCQSSTLAQLGIKSLKFFSKLCHFLGCSRKLIHRVMLKFHQKVGTCCSIIQTDLKSSQSLKLLHLALIYINKHAQLTYSFQSHFCLIVSLQKYITFTFLLRSV